MRGASAGVGRSARNGISVAIGPSIVDHSRPPRKRPRAGRRRRRSGEKDGGYGLVRSSRIAIVLWNKRNRIIRACTSRTTRLECAWTGRGDGEAMTACRSVSAGGARIDASAAAGGGGTWGIDNVLSPTTLAAAIVVRAPATS